MSRRLLLAALGLAAGVGLPGIAVSQESPEAEAASAALSYDAGDYETAAASYRRLLEAPEGLDRAALHYNLGNAEYRTGRLGYAMLHWERSLAIRTGDGDARANVALARSVLDRRLTDAAAAGDPDTFLLELLRSMQGVQVWLRQTPPARFAGSFSAFVLLAGVCWTLLMIRRGRRGSCWPCSGSLSLRRPPPESSSGYGSPLRRSRSWCSRGRRFAAAPATPSRNSRHCRRGSTWNSTTSPRCHRTDSGGWSLPGSWATPTGMASSRWRSASPALHPGAGATPAAPGPRS